MSCFLKCTSLPFLLNTCICSEIMLKLHAIICSAKSCYISSNIIGPFVSCKAQNAKYKDVDESWPGRFYILLLLMARCICRMCFMGLPPAYHEKDWLQNRHLYMQGPARTNDLIALTFEIWNTYPHAIKSEYSTYSPTCNQIIYLCRLCSLYGQISEGGRKRLQLWA